MIFAASLLDSTDRRIGIHGPDDKIWVVSRDRLLHKIDSAAPETAMP